MGPEGGGVVSILPLGAKVEIVKRPGVAKEWIAIVMETVETVKRVVVAKKKTEVVMKKTEVVKWTVAVMEMVEVWLRLVMEVFVLATVLERV